MRAVLPAPVVLVRFLWARQRFSRPQTLESRRDSNLQAIVNTEINVTKLDYLLESKWQLGKCRQGRGGEGEGRVTTRRLLSVSLDSNTGPMQLLSGPERTYAFTQNPSFKLKASAIILSLVCC